MRFDLSVWDKDGFASFGIIKNYSDAVVSENFAGEHTLRFLVPLSDPIYANLSYRNIVRVHDKSKPQFTRRISSFDLSFKSLVVDDATDLSVGDFVQIVSLQASVFRSFVARIESISGATLTLSRLDFTAGANEYGILKFCDFKSYRIQSVLEYKRGGIALAEIQCRHIAYDMADTLFLENGRGDLTYSRETGRYRLGTSAWPGTILQKLMDLFKDSSGRPKDHLAFFYREVDGNLVNDYREISFENATIYGALVQTVSFWTDASQHVWFEVDEDRGVSIRRSVPEPASASSGLVVRYERQKNRNLEAIERSTDTSEHCTVLFPQGSN